MTEYIGDQGEVSIFKIDALPKDMVTKSVERCAKGYIISHSERGYHHVLVDGEVMEKTNNVPTGMRILYAIVNEPTSFIQDAPTPHEGYTLNPGIYMFKVAREHDHFINEARRVAD